jgi:pyruvate formate lyase activating enzyme
MRSGLDGDHGWVHSWDVSSGVDGPGTRLVVFLAGCPMRCLYCQNPDTWVRADGELTPHDRIEQLIRRYRQFIKASGGGVTISGGEPLQQASFTKRILETARARGMHTALDTCGFLGIRADDELLDATDLVLLDIKSGTDSVHRMLTGRPMSPILRFADRLAEREQPVWIRYVLVPDITDERSEVEAFAAIVGRYPNVERVDLLPFHKLGQPKYEALGIPFPLTDTPTPSREHVGIVRAEMLELGLPVI